MPDCSSNSEIEPRARRASTVVFVVKIVLPAGLLVLASIWIDWSEVGGVVRGARIHWLAVALCVALLDRVWMAAKWRYLLTHLGVSLSLFEAIAQYLIGGLVGVATQFQLSGDVTRAVRLGRSSGQHAAVAGSVVVEKLVGVLAIGVLALGSLLLLNKVDLAAAWRAPLSVAIATITAVALLPLLLLSPRGARLVSAASRYLPPRFGGAIHASLEASTMAVARLRRATIVFFGLTLGEQLVPIVGVLCLAAAFGIDLQPITVLTVMPTIMFLSRLPISIEAIGVREGLFTLLLGAAGLGVHESVTIAIASRLVDLAVVGGGGAIAIAAQGYAMRSSKGQLAS